MRFTQQQTYHRDSVIGRLFAPIMTLVAEMFGVPMSTYSRDRVTRVEAGHGVFVKSYESRLLLISYLTAYPMFTSKRLDYLDWVKAHELVTAKGHKSVEGTAALVALKGGMNSGRKVFDWSHIG